MFSPRTAATAALLSVFLSGHAPTRPANAFGSSSVFPFNVSRDTAAVVPDVISLDRGRQLFVDDYLVEQTTLKRTFHHARYYLNHPVIAPDRPWEDEGGRSTAMVFSDGVWYDPTDGLFKMWYMCGLFQATCYAQSNDGIVWKKPVLDVETGTNVVVRGSRDSSTVWLDANEKERGRRFKMFTVRVQGGGKGTMSLRVSADGIHWSQPVASSPPVGDRSTAFFNPFRGVWVYSLRDFTNGVRSRLYRENPDAAAGLAWKDADVVPWAKADDADPHSPGIGPQLYNLDATPYESLMVGLFSILEGGPDNGLSKQNEILLGFSRDGFHWERPDRSPFISAKKQAEGYENVQSAGGGFLVVADKLYFYVSDLEKKSTGNRDYTLLAVLRRDGFASMDAGSNGGILTTRPVRFNGTHLFVNLSAPTGELRAEILDESGRVLKPFSLENSKPVHGDRTLAAVQWKGAADLSTLSGKPVRFRFFLTKGALYSFWASPDRSGESRGYVAAGGPGFNGPTDTASRAKMKGI